MKRISVIAIVLSALALAATIAVPIVSASWGGGEIKTIEFDVSEDMNRFIFDKDVVYEDGMPADGSSFITRGYLYQPGTLKGDGDGMNADGSPQYPDKVIGEWICQGYMINEAAHAKGGVW